MRGIEGGPETDYDGMLAAVLAVPPGTSSATDYHRAVEKLLSALLYPSLSSPKLEQALNEGRKRVDIRYVNIAAEGFFKWLPGTNPYIFVECKNYSADPKNPEVDQLIARFSPKRGRFGILLCRSIVDRKLIDQRSRDAANADQGYIIVLDDADLRRLVDARNANSIDAEFQVLRERYDALVL